jgi:threonine/homoserine/homoserine lactone efflux protein
MLVALAVAVESLRRGPRETWPQVIVAGVGYAILIAIVVAGLSPLVADVPKAQRHRLRKIALPVFFGSELVLVPLMTWRKGPRTDWSMVIGVTFVLSMLLTIGVVHLIERDRKGRLSVAALRSVWKGAGRQPPEDS